MEAGLKLLRQCPVFATQAHNAQTAKCRLVPVRSSAILTYLGLVLRYVPDQSQETRVIAGFTFETLVVESPTLFPFALKSMSCAILLWAVIPVSAECEELSNVDKP